MKFSIIFLLLLAPVALITLPAQSQFSGWLASFNTIKVGKKLSIHAEVQLRSSNAFDHIQTLLLRGGVNYDLTKKLVVSAGYGYIPGYRSVGAVDGYAAEHRMWEQLTYKHQVNTIIVNHRLRVEQRFVAKVAASQNELEVNGYGYSNRARYYLRNMLPFKKQPVFVRGNYLVLQNEIFINYGNSRNVNGKIFDQNRFYIATGYRFNKSFDLEAGYMNQYVNGSGNEFTNNHLVQIASYFKL